MFKKKKSIKEDILENEEIQFYNLSPNEINENSIYLKAIDSAIKDPQVFNIAITGKNGAGKTSTIKTYEKLHPEYNYFNISLASFENNGQDKNTSIERSILQQLFYTINSAKIPYSRFKRIKNVQNKELVKKFIISCIILLFSVISIYLLTHPELISITTLKQQFKILCNNYFSTLGQSISTIILSLIALVGISCISYSIFKKIITTIELSNLKLKQENIEIEIKNKDTNSDSIFNKYIDEIIYFFETTKYDIIVIEDLDRFKNSTEVFIKLRELNKIINDCETINKKIKFIYAVKDEIFQDKERTKFFDFIIPIIPVINSANSRQILIDKLNENAIKIFINDDFIKDITIYIDDMRILNNIINEFNIYRKNLNIDNLSMENLFSIIVLKNIFPREFADLQESKGVIYNIFNTKIKRINRYRKKIEDEKSNYKKNIKELENNYKHSLTFIKQILWLQIKNVLNQNIATDLYINNTNITYEQFISPNNKLEDIKNSKFKAIKSFYNSEFYSFDDIQKKIPENDRINIDAFLKENSNDVNITINDLENKIQNLDVILKELNNMNNTSLSYLISKFGIENILSIDERKNDLLVFLLINGYLDEDYDEYINYFYSGTLKTNDKSFIISVKSQKGLGYNYELKEKKEILENLSLKYFSQKEILNFDLLDYLLKHYPANKEQLQLIFNRLKDESNLSFNFCTSFMLETQNLELFVNLLCINWPTIWKYITENCSDELKKLYMYNIIKYASPVSIKTINENQDMKTYLISDSDFIKNFNTLEEIQKVQRIILDLDLKFKNLDSNDFNTKLARFIVDTNHFEINKHMLYSILEKIYNYKLNIIERKNYSCILKTRNKKFIDYINYNILQYINNVYLLTGKNSKDDIQDIITLLNRPDIPTPLKHSIIKRQSNKLKNLDFVNENIWDIILKYNKLTDTWDNIISYYIKKNITNELIMYINFNFKNLIKSKMDANKKYKNNIYTSLYKNLVLEEQINEKILKCLHCILPTELLEKNLNINRIKILIEQGNFPITQSTYNLIKTNYNDLLILFIEKNVTFFINKQKDLEYGEKEVSEILLKSNISDENKLTIISNLNSNVICKEEKEAYMYYSLILSTTTKIKLPLNLLHNLLHLLDETAALNLLISQCEQLTELQILDILDKFSYPYNTIKTKQIIKLKKNNINIKFVNMIKRKNFSNISSIKENNNYYIIYKKRTI